MHRWFSAAVLTAFVLMQCGPRPGSDDVPIAPGAKADSYGTDDRRDLHQLDANLEARLLKWARATALVIKSTNLLAGDGGQRRLDAVSLRERMFRTKIAKLFGLRFRWGPLDCPSTGL